MSKVIPISLATLSSLNDVALFFHDHESDLCVKGERVQAFGKTNGFILTVGDSTTLHDHAIDNTFVVMELFMGLLQYSPVHHAVRNSSQYNSSGPLLFLHWLYVDDTTDQLKAKSVPVYTALVNTFYAAASNFFDSKSDDSSFTQACKGFTKHLGVIDAQLILKAPTLPNEEQFKLLIAAFGDTANYEFKYLLPTLNDEGKVREVVEYFNNTNESTLVLRVQKVSKHSPYTIALREQNFDIVVYEHDIDRIMQLLANSSDSISSNVGSFSLPPWCKTFELTPLSHDDPEQGYTVPLFIRLNTAEAFIDTPYELLFFKRICTLQQKRLRNELFIPLTLFGAEYDGDIAAYVHSNACKLHTMEQQALASWMLGASHKSLATFVHSILGRHHNAQPYTLPASQQVIQHASLILGYLLNGEGLVVNAQDLLSFLDDDSLRALTVARAQMSEYVRDKVRSLLYCCSALSYPEKMEEVRAKLKELCPNASFTRSYNIAFAPEETALCSAYTLYLLSKVYDLYGGIVFSYSDCPPEVLLSSSVLLLFMLQSFVQVDHLTKAAACSLSLTGVTFNIRNYHDGIAFDPYFFFLHDHLIHPFYINFGLDSYSKGLVMAYRLYVSEHFEMLFSLLRNSSTTCTFLGEEVSMQNMLEVLKGLYFFIMHENSTVSTTARMRILPFYCGKAFLDKKHMMFDASKAESVNCFLSLDKAFTNLPPKLKALLPIARQSTFPYALACWMFDSIIEESRLSFQKDTAFDMSQVEQSFLEKLEQQTSIIKTLETQWDKLYSSGLITKAMHDVTSKQERYRLLASPKNQARLSYGVINFDLRAAQEATKPTVESTAKLES